ncbi:hypothetical protein CGRA01v4_10154 [Colletotrichum graminicola]|nr:hypothetical protein CGRA01v4_10154 [Colletotrichum graminicola]
MYLHEHRWAGSATLGSSTGSECIVDVERIREKAQLTFRDADRLCCNSTRWFRADYGNGLGLCCPDEMSIGTDTKKKIRNHVLYIHQSIESWSLPSGFSCWPFGLLWFG